MACQPEYADTTADCTQASHLLEGPEAANLPADRAHDNDEIINQIYPLCSKPRRHELACLLPKKDDDITF